VHLDAFADAEIDVEVVTWDTEGDGGVAHERAIEDKAGFTAEEVYAAGFGVGYARFEDGGTELVNRDVGELDGREVDLSDYILASASALTR